MKRPSFGLTFGVIILILLLGYLGFTVASVEIPHHVHLVDCDSGEMRFSTTFSAGRVFELLLAVPRSGQAPPSFHGTVTVSEAGHLIVDYPIGSDDMTLANWLYDAPELQSYILTWRKAPPILLHDQLVGRHRYDFVVRFSEQPPKVSFRAWVGIRVGTAMIVGGWQTVKSAQNVMLRSASDATFPADLFRRDVSTSSGNATNAAGKKDWEVLRFGSRVFPGSDVGHIEPALLVLVEGDGLGIGGGIVALHDRQFPFVEPAIVVGDRSHLAPDGRGGGSEELHVTEALLIDMIFCLSNGRHQPDKCRDEQAELFDKCGLNGIRHSLPKR